MTLLVIHMAAAIRISHQNMTLQENHSISLPVRAVRVPSANWANRMIVAVWLSSSLCPNSLTTEKTNGQRGAMVMPKRMQPTQQASLTMPSHISSNIPRAVATMSSRQTFILRLLVPGRQAIPKRRAVMATQKMVTYMVASCFSLTPDKMERVDIQPPTLLSRPMQRNRARPRMYSSLTETFASRFSPYSCFDEARCMFSGVSMQQQKGMRARKKRLLTMKALSSKKQTKKGPSSAPTPNIPCTSSSQYSIVSVGLIMMRQTLGTTSTKPQLTAPMKQNSP